MRYTFGSTSIDVGLRMVTNAGAPVHLTRKAFELLVLLLERWPDAVTKEQIHERLWPDTFVSEASVQTLVHEIRQAIDDAAAERSWIRTVRGVGYRFEGDVATRTGRAPAAPDRPAAWLVRESMRVPLRPGVNLLGRDSNDVIEIDHPAVSRRHARLTVGERTTIEDLGSKNGTWVNGHRVSGSHVLADRDLVSFGSVSFVLQLGRRPTSTESIDLPPQR